MVIQRASNKLALRTYIVQCNMCKDFKNSKLRDLVSQQNLSQTKIMSNNTKNSFEKKVVDKKIESNLQPIFS